MSELPDSEHTVAVVPNRLAVDRQDVRGILAEPDVALASRVAGDWQQMSSGVLTFEMAAVLRGVQRDRMTEFVGLTASLGEQLALARSALIEAELWRLKRLDHDDLGDEMCHRAIVELFAHFVLGAGHAFANLTARGLALDSAVHGKSIDRFGSSFPPHSDERDDWISLNRGTVRQLRRLARDLRPEASVLAEPVTRLVNSEGWQRLERRRSVDYHRRRPQSADVVAAPLESLWKQTVPGKWILSHSTGVPAPPAPLAVPAYLDARLAFAALVQAMVEFADVRDTVIRALTAPARI